nr:unnamed protein product [Digitaria exilis]
MDPIAERGGRSRRGSRGGWNPSATGGGRPTPVPNQGFGRGERGRQGGGAAAGAAAGRTSVAGRQSRRGGTMVWRPRHPQSPVESGSADGGATSPAVAAALDNEDILGEILLRLSPGPSSLPRAGAVCKRWRRLVTDSRFLRRFREHHRKPPLLGLFTHNRGKIVFSPLLDPPDRMPPAAGFSLRLQRGSRVCGCRHGRVLVVTSNPFSFLVWDPVSGDQCLVPLPRTSGGGNYMIDGTIICAGGEQGHVHGSCHSSPFLVVFVGRCGDEIIVWVYSSETGTWGDAISIMWPSPFDPDDFDCCNTLVGNSVYWLFHESNMVILEFDLDRQCLATVDVPPELTGLNTSVRDKFQFLIMPASGNGLGFLILDGLNARIWKRNDKCDGDTRWMLTNIFKLDLPLRSWARRCFSEIIGFAEEYNMVFISIGGGVVFMVHAESGTAPVFSLMPPAMSKEDLLTHIEVVKDQQLNPKIEDCEMDMWDPMIHEASIAHLPL